MTKRPDQDLINSLFDAIEQSDINAHTTIEILSETHDLKNLKRHVFLPEEESGEIAQDPLDLYLHSVFYGAQKTLNLLIDIGSNHSSISNMPTNETNIIILQKSKSLKTPLPIKNGNDVCWAVLSDDEHALTKLEDAYVQHDLKMDINAREAIPINNFDLNNGDAQKHTPLDLAVMRYVAERRMDIKNTEKQKQMSNAIEKKISSVIDNFGQAGKVRAIIQSDHDFEMKSHQTSANIRLLLNLGAKGSIASYFPACDETIDSPFADKNALEIKSLKDFCNENAYIFDTGLLEALTQTPPANNLTL